MAISSNNETDYMFDTHSLDMAFRGSRDYLQGADIYDQVLAKLGQQVPEGPVMVQYHSFSRTQLDLVGPVGDVAPWRACPNYRGEIRFGAQNEATYIALMASDRPITERTRCNEDEVVSTASVDVESRTATLPFPSVATTMEMVVFLNKQLHFKVLPQVKEKWLFVKLELSRRLPQAGERELKLEIKHVLGNRFTKAMIVIDDQSFGYITFATLQ